MTAAGQLAFANVRARARAARLLGPETRSHLAAARDPAARAAIYRKLGAASGDAADLVRARLASLLADYEVLARAYPIGGPLIAAMARLHEIENLKVLYRAARRHLDAEEVRRLLRPLGRLAALRLGDVAEVRSLRDLAAITEGTPYAEMVAGAATGSLDPAAVELAWDRAGSQALVREARALPRSQRDAGALVLDWVRERDLDVIHRAAAYGMAREIAAESTALLAEEMTPDELATAGADFGAQAIARRRRRRRACAAAFIGSPLRLAPGIAYLLLAEEELRGLAAIAEGAGDPAANEIVARALAGSALGD
jgi:vacuolar-type H+-ATPase subunit C/Vma6